MIKANTIPTKEYLEQFEKELEEKWKNSDEYKENLRIAVNRQIKQKALQNVAISICSGVAGGGLIYIATSKGITTESILIILGISALYALIAYFVSVDFYSHKKIKK